MTAYSSALRVTGLATAADAEDVHALTREVFGAYAHLQPQPSSLRETVDDVAAALERDGGLVVREAGVSGGGVALGRLVAVVRFSEHDGGFWLRRLAVLPDVRGEGLASGLVDAAEVVARKRGHSRLQVGVRTPLVDVIAWWRRRGFGLTAERDYWVDLARPMPLTVQVPAAQDMHDLGLHLAGSLRAGDLVVLSGDLGAGKTTLTRGIGAGMQVRGDVTSPTFVVARVHPSTVDGPPLVHVDAYRLGDIAEVDDLDLDASLEESVTVVEWGTGMVEGLAESRLELTLRRGSDEQDETRVVTARGLGDRWAATDLGAVLHRPVTSLDAVLLALDTATPAVTVALADGDRVLASRSTVDARRHGELLAPAIAAVLAEAGVDRRSLTRVAVGVGPGPFTGLRVGLVTARTLGAVLEIPVVGVCTLDAIALQSGLDGPFRVVTDARRKQVHWAAYETDGADGTASSDGRDSGLRRVDGPHVDLPADVAWDGPAVGAGAEMYAEHFLGHVSPEHVSAVALAAWVARGLPLLAPDPLYLRRPDAVERDANTPRKRVL